MPMISTQNPRLIQGIMKEAAHMHAFPATATHAIQMLSDPHVDIQRLGQVLSADQVIASQILRHANSAYYAGVGTCTTVPEGIMRIGLRQIRSVLYGVAVSGLLSTHLSGYQMKQGELFRHSVVVATATRRLASMLRHPDPEEAYAAGLLHDIGKLLLDKYVSPQYAAMAAEVAKGRHIIEVEERFVGTDHATVGGLIAEVWSLPRPLQEAIQYHHAPTLVSRPRLAALVAFANIIVLQSGVGLTPLGVPPLQPELLGLLHIGDDDLGRLAYCLRPEIEAADLHFQAGSQVSPKPLASGLLARTTTTLGQS